MRANWRRPYQTVFIALSALLMSFAGLARADDESVWATLKKGGNVILLRHTHVETQEGIGKLVPGNCAAEINLSARGVAEAKRISAAFQAHGIPIGDVLTSPFCRCVDTGKIAFGKAVPIPYLVAPGVAGDSQAKANDERVMQDILNYNGTSNLVMITHDLNIASVVLEPAAMGELFVVRPTNGDFEVVGKIRMGD